jgi:transcriptional regulator with XRE-family HTH domain
MRWEQVVGINIRRLRKARGLTQESLAAECGIDMRYLGGIERGQENPTVAVVGRVAKALGVHPSDGKNRSTRYLFPKRLVTPDVRRLDQTATGNYAPLTSVGMSIFC